MDKRQSAVEWLVSQLYPTISIRLNDTYIKELIEQAKEMERDQIMIAASHSHFEGGNYKMSGLELFEYGFKYYTSTYGK